MPFPGGERAQNSRIVCVSVCVCVCVCVFIIYIYIYIYIYINSGYYGSQYKFYLHAYFHPSIDTGIV